MILKDKLEKEKLNIKYNFMFSIYITNSSIYRFVSITSI